MTPQELFLAARDAGCRLVTKEGRLFATPPGRVPAALRPLLEQHKAAVVAWLERAEEEEAKLDAIAAETVRCNPFDDPDPAAFELDGGGLSAPVEAKWRTYELVRLVDLHGPSRYVAITMDQPKAR